MELQIISLKFKKSSEAGKKLCLILIDISRFWDRRMYKKANILHLGVAIPPLTKTSY